MKIFFVSDADISGQAASKGQQAIVPDDLGEELVDEGVAEQIPEDTPGVFQIFSRQRDPA